MVLPHLWQLSLIALCTRFSMDPGRSHRAHDDGLATATVFTGPARFTAMTQFLQHACYFLSRLQYMTDPAQDHDAAQWLRTITGMAGQLADPGASRETTGKALQDFAVQVKRCSQSEMEKPGTKFAYAVSKPVHELRGTSLFESLVAQWRRLARNLHDRLAVGHAIFETEDKPVQGQYVRQRQSWLEGTEAVRYGVDHVLPQSGTPPAAERHAIIRWVELRKQADACKFHLTRYCGTAVWRARILSQGAPVLFLQVSRATPGKGGYLTQRRGITQLPQARLDAVWPRDGNLLLLNLWDLPDPTGHNFRSTVEVRQPALTAQITSNAVLQGNKDQRKTVAALLRHNAQGQPVHVLEAWAGRQPTIFCCTSRALQGVPWESMDVQCVLMARLPFTPFQDPWLDHQSRYAPRALDRFHDQTLPICTYNLMRVSDLLDVRLVTKRYGARLCAVLLFGLWQHSVVEPVPAVLWAWLADPSP